MKKTGITLLIIFSFFLCFVTAYASNELKNNKSHRTEIHDKQIIENSEIHDNDSRILLAQAWPPQGERPQRDSDRIYEMIALRFNRFLDLNDEQFTKFTPILKDYSITRSKINSKIRALADSLAKNADDESISIKELNKQITQYRKLNNDIIEEEKKFLKKLDNILSDRQSIKLEIFEDVFINDLSNRFSEINRRQSEEMRGNRGF